MTNSASTSRRSRRAGVARLMVALAALLTVAACQQERAVQVPFPDDPRVLNGAWEVTTTGLYSDIERAVLSADGKRLLLVRDGRDWLYLRDTNGEWQEGDAAPYGDHLRAQEDPSLDALVALKRSGREVAVSILSLGDASLTSSTVMLPEGLSVSRLTVGSGRLFALLSGAAGAQQLHWFDLATGAAEGSRELPRHEDGMLASSNGRMLSFWDVRAYDLWLLDTDQPGEPLRHVRLETCRSNAVAESSDDGRWFLATNCAGNLRVLDLNEANPSWRAIGVKHQGAPKFAHGASNPDANNPDANNLVVWHDDAGHVRSHDLSGHGGTTTLVQLDAKPDGYFYNDVLQVQVTVGLLLADDGHGRVAVVQLEDTAASSSLPTLPLSGAALTLTATDPHNNPSTSYYTVTGTFEANGEELELEGSVFSDRFHDYITTLALPPARLQGGFSVRSSGAAEDDEALYHLEFSSEDRNAVSYDGTLWDAAYGLTYVARLQRTEP